MPSFPTAKIRVIISPPHSTMTTSPRRVSDYGIRREMRGKKIGKSTGFPMPH